MRQAILIYDSKLKASCLCFLVLDAMSKIPEGVLSGHTNSYGDFDECLATRGEISTSGMRSDFKGQYCGAFVVPEIGRASCRERM